MKKLVATKTRFPLGDIVITKNAQSELSHKDVFKALVRHAACDWGNVTPEDAERNFEALHQGSRLFSEYGDDTQRFWIITEADRSATTILLPSDY